MRGLVPALLCLATVAQAEPARLRVGTITPEGSPYYAAALANLRRIEANSGDRVRFHLFGGGAAGDEPSLVADVRACRLPATAVTATAAEAVVPEIAALSLPFLFRDGAEADAVIEGLWPELTKAFERHGFWLIAHTVVGFRSIGSQAPVRC